MGGYRIPEKIKQRAQELFAEGMSIRGIAKELGISKFSAHNFAQPNNQYESPKVPKVPKKPETYMNKHARDEDPDISIYALRKLYGMSESEASDCYGKWRNNYLRSDKW